MSWAKAMSRANIDIPRAAEPGEIIVHPDQAAMFDDVQPRPTGPGARFKPRANGGAPVRCYGLPGGITLEVYQLYPGYTVVIEQHGRRWVSAGFKVWRGPAGGDELIQLIARRLDRCDGDGGALAADVAGCWHWASGTRSAAELETRYQPPARAEIRKHCPLFDGWPKVTSRLF